MKNSLTLIALSLVVLYHGYNTVQRSEIRLGQEWNSKQVELRWKGRVLFSRSLWISAQREEFRFVQQVNGKLVHSDIAAPDSASEGLAILGYSVRFLTRQIRNDMILGTCAPHQRLYWKEELPFQYLSAENRIRDGFIPQIRHFIADLESQGVTVVVVPIPTKVDIERDLLPPRLPKTDPWVDRTDEAETPGELYETLLNSDRIHVVDVRSIFKRYRKTHPTQDLFVPTDSHWTSLGISLSAIGVVQNLISRGWRLSSPQLVPHGHDEVRYDHDLIRHLQLPQALLRHLPSFHWAEPLYTVTRVEPHQAGKRVVACGASYSDRMRLTPHGFGAVVSHALNRTFVDASVVGGGTLGAVSVFKEKGRQLHPGDLFILETAFRHPFPASSLPTLEVVEPRSLTARNP